MNNNSTWVQAHGRYAAAVDRGPFRFLSGLSALPTSATAEATWVERAEGREHREAVAVHRGVSELLADVGGYGAMLRQHIYQANKRHYPVFERQRIEHERTPAPSSGVGVDEVGPMRDAAWEIDGIALSPEGRRTLGERKAVSSPDTAPSASFYSQAVRAGEYVFAAGMIPVDTKRGRVIRGYEDVPEEGRLLRTGRSHPDSRHGPIVAQTWWAYQQAFDSLRDAGLGPDDVCNSTIFLTDAADTADALRVHGSLFEASMPAVQVVVLDEIGHHGTLVEIECTAFAGGPESFGGRPSDGVSEAVRAGQLVFTSDHLGTTAARGLSTAPENPENAEVVRYFRTLAREFPEPLRTERILARTWAALTGTRSRLELAGVTAASLWVRMARPFGLATFELVRPLVFPEPDFALSLLSVESVGQDSGAEVSISALGVDLSA